MGLVYSLFNRQKTEEPKEPSTSTTIPKWAIDEYIKSKQQPSNKLHPVV